MKKAEIKQENWTIDVGEEDIALQYSTRAGNDVQKIDFDPDSFSDLYNLILSVSQLHPEWLNTN